jgi:hypothetical protein
MIDNIELIKPLLNFEKEGDFYMLYVFKRKKDQTTDKANHQSVRTIKSYCIESVEHLEQRYDEIKQLCEMFKARAYIHINKQKHKDVGMQMIVDIVNRIQSGQINQKHVFDSVVGQVKMHEKRWIVDIDTKDESLIGDVINTIDQCKPIKFRAIVHTYKGDGTIEKSLDIVTKVIKKIPTKSGYHLITERFDVMEFKKQYADIDIQKKNPTLLYYPESLSTNTNKIAYQILQNSTYGKMGGLGE